MISKICFDMFQTHTHTHTNRVSLYYALYCMFFKKLQRKEFGSCVEKGLQGVRAERKPRDQSGGLWSRIQREKRRQWPRGGQGGGVGMGLRDGANRARRTDVRDV